MDASARPFERLVVELSIDGGQCTCHQPIDLARMDLSRLHPVASPPAYKGRRAYSGYWWLASTRTSVEFSTLVERDLLIEADYSNVYSHIVHNPFRIRWGSVSSSSSTWVPPFLALRPDAAADADLIYRAPLPHPDSMAHFSAASGITLRQGANDAEGAYTANLRWLAGFRHSRWAPSDRQRDCICDAVGRSGDLKGVIRRAGRDLGASSSDVTAWVCYMLWHRELSAPLDDGLLVSRLDLEVATA